MRQTVKRIIPIVLLTLFGAPCAMGAERNPQADGVFPAYSVQLRAFPIEERARGLARLNALKDDGYLAYAYELSFDGEDWFNVAIGAFSDREAARAFGNEFTEAEGERTSVVEAPVRVVAGSGGDFVVTPTALWIRDRNGPHEVYAFGAERPFWRVLPRVILAKLSPDRTSLAFVYAKAVHVASLRTREVIALTDGRSPMVSPVGDYPWQPSWSPSGRHVVFLDRAVYNEPIELWAARGDGSDLRCLSCDPDDEQATRWFIWHPTADRLLFVRTTRRDRVGGTLMSVSMDGAIQPVDAVSLGEFEEIVGPLWIEDGDLRFKLLRSSDALYSQHSTSQERLPIGAL